MAKREGITRTYASHEANAPETRLLMAELLAEHRDEIKGLVRSSLKVIKGTLAAKRFVTTPAGKKISLGADPFAQLTGVKRLIEMVQACRTEQAPQHNLTITWEQFLTICPEEFRR